MTEGSKRRLKLWIRLLGVTRRAENELREYLRVTHDTTLPRFDVMAALYRRGGFGYGEIKKALADKAESFFAPARERRQALAADPQQVREILAEGARRARQKAAVVLDRAQKACGLKG